MEDRVAEIHQQLELEAILCNRYLRGYILYIQDPSLLPDLHRLIRLCTTAAKNMGDK